MIKDLEISTDIASAETMDDSELQGIITSDLEDAVSYIDSDLSPIRAKGTEYYRGDPFGNEEEGRSQVVAMEVRDTVSAMMPSLMRVFFSTENTVEFLPRGPEDEKGAQQATDYANLIFNSDNNGFMTTYAIFKDALVSKCGIAKYWWEEEEKVRIEEYSGLDDQTLQILSQENAEVKIVVSYPDPAISQEIIDQVNAQAMAAGQPAPQVPMLHDVQIKRIVKDGRVRIMAVPPEELVIDRRARSFEDAALIAHRQMLTVADLISMGYDEDEVRDNLTSNDLDSNEEFLARQPLNNITGNNNTTNPMMQRVLYVEAYSQVDYDGDGIPELRKICCMGSGYNIVRNLPASYIPFVDFPCDPEPHTSPLESMSIFDITHDLQEIKSEILRNTLDSLAQSIHPRTAIVEGQVNIDDVLNNETGAVIRMRAPGMVQPFNTPFVGQAAFPMLDYVDQIKEDRTGMSKAAMGLNADALQSSTKAAVAATISASQGRIELTSRILAEGMKKLFKGILFLITTHQDKPRMVRLRGSWTNVNPQEWRERTDLTVRVGLGTGNEEQKREKLMLVAQLQQQLGGAFGLVGPAQAFSLFEDLAKTMGFDMPEKYVMSPASPQYQQMQQQRGQGPGNPLAEAEQVKGQFAMQIKQLQEQYKQQIDGLKLQFENAQAATLPTLSTVST